MLEKQTTIQGKSEKAWPENMQRCQESIGILELIGIIDKEIQSSSFPDFLLSFLISQKSM